MIGLKRSILCLGLALLVFSNACFPKSYPSLFDLVDYMIGVSLDPGRIMINARYYEWHPTVKDIQWAFGAGTSKNSQTLAYEKIGLIARHDGLRVVSLELLYDPETGEFPCEVPFQGSFFVNGTKISSKTTAEELEKAFADFKRIHSPQEVKVFSKTEEIIVAPMELSIEKRDSIRSFIEEHTDNSSIYDIVCIEKYRIPTMGSVKPGFYPKDDLQKPWLENYLKQSLGLGVSEYRFFYKDPIEIDFMFHPETKKMVRVFIKLGADRTKKIEFY